VSGDIVQELRFLGSIQCPYGCDEVGNPAADAIEARDAEIERLRAAGDALAEACAFVRAHPPEVTRSLAAWQEARK
jgi:hypothetical protein